MLAIAPAHAADACCSCQTQLKEMFSNDALPCDFDIPKNWQVMTGDDGSAVNAVAGAQCTNACPVAGGLSLSVAKKPNANAASMEQMWQQVMQPVGSARCGDATVTFYNPPGADPNGLMGGLRFHIGHNGQKYGASATFTCPEPGQWKGLQTLFIDSFRTNPSSTFPGN
jgi:hypothetical protein